MYQTQTNLECCRSLDEDAIHIWQVPLQADPATLASLSNLLDEQENARAQRFVHEQAQQAFIISHAVLRQLLSAYTNTSAKNVHLISNAHKKPYLSATTPPLFFNMSHSHEQALYAFSRREVGVDLESVSTPRDSIALARRFFADSEVQALQGLANDALHNAFIRIWTYKEAWCKALGTGLQLPLSNCEVDAHQTVQYLSGEQDVTLYALPQQSPYHAALAVLTHGPVRFSYFALEPMLT